MNAASGLTLVACLLSAWICLRCDRRRVVGAAVSAVIVIATIVPVASILDQTAAVSAMAAVIAVCLIARVRCDGQAERGSYVGLILVLLFLGWSTLRILGQFSLLSTVLQVGIILTAAALAVIVPLLRRSDLVIVADVVLVLTVVHTVYAALEQVDAVGALWQLREKSLETIDDRANVLLPWLAGRSPSSFAHPIPFAFFACFAALVLTHAGLKERRFRYILGAGSAIVALGMSGTRSAFVALIGAAAAYAIANIRWRRLLAFTAGAGVVAMAALLVNLPQLLALDSRFESSVSYIHRALVNASWDSLWAQDDVVKWIGSGAGATAELFRSGTVRGAGKLIYFDNAFISLFALSGLTAVILFCLVLLWSLRGGGLAIAVCVFIAIMGFAFDEQLWQFPLLTMVFGSLLPRSFSVLGRRESPPVPTEPPGQGAAASSRRARRAVSA